MRRTASRLGLKIGSVAHHRNGVCGEPFHVVAFEYDCQQMVATVFDEPGYVAVLNATKAATGNVAFGDNSFRGDHFEPELRAAIKAYEGGRS